MGVGDVLIAVIDDVAVVVNIIMLLLLMIMMLLSDYLCTGMYVYV